MDWFDSASRWIVDSYRQGLSIACPHPCQERLKKRREQVRAAVRRSKKRLVH